jgi:hypothetical protein
MNGEKKTMGTYLSTEGEHLIKLSGSQLYQFFRKLVDLIAENDLGYNEVIVRYVTSLDYDYHGEIYRDNLQDHFKNKPEDLGILISLIEQAGYEFKLEQPQQFFVSDTEERFNHFIKRLKFYYELWSEKLEK